MRKLFFICIISVLFLLSACNGNERIGSPKQTPLYPNAENITVSVNKDSNITIFQTNDKPEQVLEFYRNNLIRNGWDESDSDAESIRMGYVQFNGPIFEIRVLARRNSSSKTEVVLQELTFGRM